MPHNGPRYSDKRAYYLAHREELLAQGRARRAADPEVWRAYERRPEVLARKAARMRAYRAAHPEEMRIRDAANHQKHRIADNARTQRYGLDHREERRTYDLAHRERNAAAARARYAKRREAIRARARVWRVERAEIVRAQCRASYARNIERRRADARARRPRTEAEKASMAAYQREHYRRNPGYYAHRQVLRRARRLGAAGSHTAEEWQEKLELFAGCCAYCGRSDLPLRRDHKTPLSRGGTNDIGNIVPACHPCNSRKYTKTAAEFLGLTRRVT